MADLAPTGPDQFDAESFLSTLTTKPGVYQMLDHAGNFLYVGKARNLKNRVSSYFRAAGLASKTMALVAKIADVQITVTNSETEALLLEQSLIKKERPPYNIVLRDDKSYPYIYLTDHTEYPRLTFHRGSKRKTGRYFGPFPSASAVRESLNILQKLFRIRPCEDSFFKNRSRPCLQYQIQRCSGPCVGHIEPQEYKEDVDLAILFLEGSSNQVLSVFRQKMDTAAERLEFERAAKFRDQMRQLRKVQEQQYVHASVGDVDIFAVVQESGVYCVQALFMRDGRMLGQRTWFPKNELALDEAEFLGAFLSQYYLGGMERDIPKSIIASVSNDEMDLLAQTLAQRVERRVEITSSVRGQRARWLKLAADNATYAVNTFIADKRNVYARFVSLQDNLGLDDVPKRMECFDISHTMGEATVASCVVFDSNGPLKSDYRRFNIEGVTAGDDYGAMEQALRRRYTRLKQGEGLLPDLLIIDGGIGQMTQAKKVLAELQVEDVVLLGIAKGPTRRPGLEKFYLESGEIQIPPQGDAAHLLQHIRDEAHRFAITGHRQRRQKQRRASELEDIPGVGPKRRRELLTHFGGLAALKGASIEEMAKVPGISRKLAEEVYGTLHVQ
ncbi:MAG: excinuclease ABC subunit UvrC [Proteobacteria bacterium]|nr:excinuclease ABC subunit UvrC [Pseudomonadota bacterium]